MIHHLNGILIEKTPVSAVIETNGIGFEVRIPLSTYDKLPEGGEKCMLLCYLHLSQDDAKLYGFDSKAERELFILLIGISGIGPKIALSVLSTFPIATFARAVQKSEENTISKVPGLGKKTAQRIIIELRDQVLRFIDYDDSKPLVVAEKRAIEIETALESLGFNVKEIRKELSLLNPDVWNLPTEQIIKETIKKLYQKR